MAFVLAHMSTIQINLLSYFSMKYTDTLVLTYL